MVILKCKDYEECSKVASEIFIDAIKQNPNIVLGLYGHIDDEYLSVVQTKGLNGNIVSEILIDPQRTDLLYDGGVGLVAFLYFSNGGKNVELRYYSTIRNQYYRPENQFSFEVNTISRENITQ